MQVESGVRYALVCFVSLSNLVEHERAFLLRGDECRLMGNHKEALRLYRCSLAAATKAESAYLGIAKSLAALGRPELAIDAYR